MIASSNSVNKVLYVVQDANQNGFWNIQLLIATLIVLGISKDVCCNFIFVFPFSMNQFLLPLTSVISSSLEIDC